MGLIFEREFGKRTGRGMWLSGWACPLPT